jgi:hypothetical protein
MRGAACIGEVRNGFGGDAEVRSAFGPSHGKDERESYQLFFARQAWEGDGQKRDVRASKPHAVVAVGDVGFEHVNRSVLWWGKVKLLEKTTEGAAKLHGIRRGKASCSLVDAVKGEVHNDTWATIPLWDHADRGKLEVAELPY